MEIQPGISPHHLASLGRWHGKLIHLKASWRKASASRDLAAVTALAKEKDWLFDIQEKSRQLDTLLADASRMMAHTDEMIQQIEVDQVSHTLVQSQALIQRLNQQMDHLEKLLTQVENSESLLNRLVYDSTLSRQVDTTLYNLNKTLEQIHSKKVIVGLNRKRQK